jgi:hypothetical protein
VIAIELKMSHFRSDKTYKNIELVLIISLVYILSSGIINAVSSNKSPSIAFGFHTNSTRNMTIPGIGLPNMEGLQPAIEAQEHIKAASQALLGGNNSEVLLQLQLANRMLSHFTGSGLVNTSIGNITASQTPPIPNETNAGLTNNQTGSASSSPEESSALMSRQQETCSQMRGNDGEVGINQNCLY